MRLPADDPKILLEQLLRELKRLVTERSQSEAPEEPWLYQAYLEKFLISAWRRVASGELQAPRDHLELLAEPEDIVKRFLPNTGHLEPHIKAANDVEALVKVLEVADRCLNGIQEARRAIKIVRSPIEEAVLKVLFENIGVYLRRGEIYGKLLSPPTRGRISQILSSLLAEGLLLRVQAPAQGRAAASFFALSESGQALCRASQVSSLKGYFQPSEGIWGQLLREPEALAIGNDPSHQSIASFYSHRRGMGRTLALVHGAIRLAGEALSDKPILIADLTFESSEIGSHLGIPKPDCVGFHGMFLDYMQQPQASRSRWLEQALVSPTYTTRPLPKLPNLVLLPSGMDFSETTFGGNDRFLDQIEQEIHSVSQGPNHAPLKADAGFWGDLRRACYASFCKTLIDSSARTEAVAYASTILLPDELVVFTRPGEKEVGPARVVIGNFLWRESAAGKTRNAPISFVFTICPELPRLYLRRVVNLILGLEANDQRDFYRILPLYYNTEVARGGLLVDDNGRWFGEKGPGHQPSNFLAAGYDNLSHTLASPIPPAIWKARMRLLARRVREYCDLIHTGSSAAREGVVPLARAPILASVPHDRASVEGAIKTATEVNYVRR